MPLPSDDDLHGPQRPADFPRRSEPSAERARHAGSAGDGAEQFANSETAMGGADAVEKTSYVVGEGTEPGAQQRAHVTARTTAGGGFNPVTWIVGALAAAIAIFYAISIFR